MIPGSGTPAGLQSGPWTPSTQKRPSQPCRWCGREVADAGLGRRRQYCRQSCRQRAYEQRAMVKGTSLAPDSVVLTADEAAELSDRVYQVRCAAEDVATAVEEGAEARRTARTVRRADAGGQGGRRLAIACDLFAVNTAGRTPVLRLPTTKPEMGTRCPYHLRNRRVALRRLRPRHPALRAALAATT